jgi:hypothetical protein
MAGVGAEAGLGFLGEQSVAVELGQLAGDGQGLVVEARGESSGLVFAGALKPPRGQLPGGGEGARLPPHFAVRKEPAVAVTFGGELIAHTRC